jgi:8-oxo-dGTP pyrophosphatase MutT (NUDIX family)
MQKRQFTASLYVFHQDKVLLHYHQKLQTHLPPGGHLEPGELPVEAALREALEETGLEITIHSPSLSFPHSFSTPAPRFIMVQQIPERKEEEAHQHVDFIYFGQPAHPHLSPQAPFFWLPVNALSSIALLPDTKVLIEKMAKEAV